MSMIDIQIDIYKHQEKVILNDVHLQIDAKDCFGLVGLNGAGKTTLLRLLLNFIYLQEGQITIDGIEVDKAKSRQNLFYLPEKFSPQDFFTGYEYLDYIREAYKVDIEKSVRLDRYQQLAESIAFDTAALKKKMSQYSKGMLQKIGIMSAILSDKALWILDEPMSGLDPHARYLFKKIIQEANANGKTILLCTHMLADVAEFCNKLVAMHEGKIAYAGTPGNFLLETKTNNIEDAFLNLVKLT